MQVVERICTGWFARWLYRRGWRGLTLPNLSGGITIRYWGYPACCYDELDDAVTQHEWGVHVPQIERMGGLRYLAAYGWRWLRIVVRNRSFAGWHDQHPMERE